MKMGGSMFYEPAHHRDLGKIVKIDTPANARKAANQLLKMFRKARTRKRKVTIKRAAVLAANRCAAMRKRKNLSAKERRELKQIEKIYRDAAKKMVL